MNIDMTKVSEAFKKLNPGFTGATLAPVAPPPKRMEHTAEDSQAANEMCDAANAPRLERQLQGLCEYELRKRGINVFLHLSPKAREKAGWPDLVFPLPGGRFAGIELKTKTGKVRPEQTETLAAMKALGAAVAVIRSLIQFREFLDAEGCP